jgi:hypothetical protein
MANAISPAKRMANIHRRRETFVEPDMDSVRRSLGGSPPFPPQAVLAPVLTPG